MEEHGTSWAHSQGVGFFYIKRGFLRGMTKYAEGNILENDNLEVGVSSRGGALHMECPIPAGSRRFVFRKRSLVGCDCHNTKRITCPYNNIKGLEVDVSKAKKANLIPIVRGVAHRGNNPRGPTFRGWRGDLKGLCICNCQNMVRVACPSQKNIWL